eukprot:CAMPEP_0194048358 /NCGR_PEP_ID=MMETSP0009_2-20130614/27045_1 /TAXON_ID=210454 /ORGANISM="Grammatophora oceanica, Strain CCMP 410" /LENGTH=196 /DNA_ID=CAMNT_0038694203 /DNA_START=62 /DNA_END=652 /DNA_ORIENTATION=-
MTFQCIEWRSSPSRFRSCLVLSLAVWNIVWVIFVLSLEVEDYQDGTFKDWPFQVPAYALTLIWLFVDCFWWFYLVGRQSGAALEDGAAQQHSLSSGSAAPMWIVAGYGVLLVMLVGLMIRWIVAWASGSDKYGDADWGGSNSRNFALGYIMLIAFIAAFVLSRMYRSGAGLQTDGGDDGVTPKPAGGEEVAEGEEP